VYRQETFGGNEGTATMEAYDGDEVTVAALIRKHSESETVMWQELDRPQDSPASQERLCRETCDGDEGTAVLQASDGHDKTAATN
jgi:hypothetical protein